jgi:hypothetical protein
VFKLLTSGLLRKILLALLLVSLAPLGVVAYAGLQSFQITREEVVAQSQKGLDQKAVEGLEARTVALAQSVAAFLQERESDLRYVATLPRTPEAYAAFASTKRAELWTIRDDESEVRFQMPLYREIAFIDLDGKEVVKVSNDCSNYPFECAIQPSTTLANVSDPAATLYKSEKYFEGVKALPENQVFIGQVTGGYVSYKKAYAGAQNRAGERYRGVLRYGMPVYENGQCVGYVVTAVEMLHFLELSAHVAPANTRLQAEIDPREADFAYVADPEGWAISHPRHFSIVGVDENGAPVPPISEENRDDPENLYHPGNLSKMGFMDASFPELVKRNQTGGAGTLNAAPWGGRARTLTYATIPYYTGRYNSGAGFGMVVLSTDSDRFHLDSELMGKQIDRRITTLLENGRWVVVGTLAVVLVLALTLAWGVAWPVLRLTNAAQRIESGAWEEARIDKLASTRGGDEVGRLSRVFASMANEVRQREIQLRSQVRELQIIIDQSKREAAVSEITDSEFFQELSAKANTMRRNRQSGARPAAAATEPQPEPGS